MTDKLLIVNKTGLNPKLCNLIIGALSLGYDVTIENVTQMSGGQDFSNISIDEAEEIK